VGQSGSLAENATLVRNGLTPERGELQVKEGARLGRRPLCRIAREEINSWEEE